MALKAAMLRTCGLTIEEFTGKTAHDLSSLGKHLREAQAHTDEQTRAQSLPITPDDLNWLRSAYLSARYPNASSLGVPANGYTDTDAERSNNSSSGSSSSSRSSSSSSSIA